MAKKRKARKQLKHLLQPLPEQAAKRDIISHGLAKRFADVLSTMLKRGQLSDYEYAKLQFYQTKANLIERSPSRDSLDRTIRGGDIGPSEAILRLKQEVAIMDRDLGSLAPLVAFITVQNESLTQWCIQQYGSREKNGNIVPINGDKRVARALLELKMAARRIVTDDDKRDIDYPRAYKKN